MTHHITAGFFKAFSVVTFISLIAFILIPQQTKNYQLEVNCPCNNSFIKLKKSLQFYLDNIICHY